MKFKELFEKVINVDKEVNEIRSILLSINYKKLSNDELKNKLNILLRKFKLNFAISGDNSHNDERFIKSATNKKIIFYANFNNYIILNGYEKFVDELLLIIEHELIHINQEKRMKYVPYKSLPEPGSLKNYSDKYEIMAYARTIITDLLKKYPREQIVKHMKIFKSLQYRHSPLYDSEKFKFYYEHFYETKVWKQLIKYMYEYLNES